VGDTLNLSFRFLGEETMQTLVVELRSMVVDKQQVTMGFSIKDGIDTEPQTKALTFIREIITSLQE
jgi:RNase P/RNase MRP subunit p29